MEYLIQTTLCTFIASFTFCFIYQIRNWTMLYAPLGAVITWLTVCLIGGRLPLAVEVVIATMAGATYAEFMARFQKEPVSAYLTVSILPCVPGRGIYRTMEYCINNDITMFLQEGVTTFITACMIATGIVIVSTNIKIFNEIKLRKAQKSV